MLKSVISIVFVFVAAAQTPKFTPPETQGAEIDLALSAAPESLRAGAAVYVLGKRSYEKVRNGEKGGLTCLVERSMPGTLEPICWDTEGAATILPKTLAEAEWRADGVDQAEIERRGQQGFASGRFRAPSRAGVAYMMSAHNYVHNGKTVIHYAPHVMIYAPNVTNKMIGADMKDPSAPWVLNEGTPHAYIIVVTAKQ